MGAEAKKVKTRRGNSLKLIQLLNLKYADGRKVARSFLLAPLLFNTRLLSPPANFHASYPESFLRIFHETLNPRMSLTSI